MVKFFNCERAVTYLQIKVIEEKIRLRLPDQYKDHLLKFNGGQCQPNVFTYRESDVVEESMIDWFLAIYDGEDDNFIEYYITYKVEQNRMPSYIIPIAHDPGGNLICISCREEDNGAIYFWDHENEVDYSVSDDSDMSNLYFIAKSLSEFLDNLHD